MRPNRGTPWPLCLRIHMSNVTEQPKLLMSCTAKRITHIAWIAVESELDSSLCKVPLPETSKWAQKMKNFWMWLRSVPSENCSTLFCLSVAHTSRENLLRWAFRNYTVTNVPTVCVIISHPAVSNSIHIHHEPPRIIIDISVLNPAIDVERIPSAKRREHRAGWTITI